MMDTAAYPTAPMVVLSIKWGERITNGNLDRFLHRMRSAGPLPSSPAVVKLENIETGNDCGNLVRVIDSNQDTLWRIKLVGYSKTSHEIHRALSDCTQLCVLKGCPPTIKVARLASLRVLKIDPNAIVSNSDAWKALFGDLSTCCPFLIELDLIKNRCWHIGDALGMFRCPKLLRLYVSHCDISQEGGRALVAAISEHSPLLEELYFGGNRRIGDVLGLLRCPNLRTLDVPWCNIGEEGGRVLAAALSAHSPLLEELNLSRNSNIGDAVALFRCPNLLRLNASGCNISQECGRALAIAISEHSPLLEELRLNGNRNLSDAAALFRCPNLRTLDVSFCDICENGGGALAAALSEHSHQLEVLNLSRNSNIGDSFGLLRCPNLRRLGVTDCNLSQKNGRALVAAISEHSPLLEELNLGGNRDIGDIIGLFRLPHLRTLNVQFCKISQEISEHSPLVAVQR